MTMSREATSALRELDSSGSTPVPSVRSTVLHYVGYERDGGGILAVVRTIATHARFRSILGAGPGFRQEYRPHLKVWCGPRVMGERITPGNAWRCAAVAWQVRKWLRRCPRRVFHGHSRAGLLVALWLYFWGESRVVVSVHCFGRQRWFYRVAAGILKARLFWLGPAMKRYYGIREVSWANCVPDCVPLGAAPGRLDEGRTKNGVRVGCVGTLTSVKQWDLVLQALVDVPAAITLVHAGGEDGTAESAAYAKMLVRLAADLGVAPRVKWCGPLREMAPFYSTIDVLVVASRWEASSVAALEAAAAGVVIVAPAESGTRDLVETTGAGWLFQAGDARDLATLLSKLAAEGVARQICSDASGFTRFSADVVARQWAEIYGRVARS